MGLVTEVWDPDGLVYETQRFAAHIAARAPLSLAGAKRIMREIAWSHSPGAETQRELHELRVAALRSADHAEGRAAFVEKRAPKFGELL